MLELIQSAWISRLHASSQWRELREDVQTLTGLHLDWLPPDGRCEQAPAWMAASPLVDWLFQHNPGRRYYNRFWNELSNDTVPRTYASRVCDAGLTHLLIPIHCSGLHIGSLFMGGYRVDAYSLEARNRLRHFLDRLGIEGDSDTLSNLIQQTRCVSDAFQSALTNRLRDAAFTVGHSLETRSSETSGRPLPKVVAQVCQWIERNFEQPLTLDEAAQVAGMNPSYFCRLFHSNTGLRFIDYVNEVRLNEARRRLRNPKTRIADIAFASGFGSLSQFNRAFTRSSGCNPRSWRAREINKAMRDSRVGEGRRKQRASTRITRH